MTEDNSPFKRVTIRDIAKEVGLHFSTVSQALKNSSRIKAETREKVQDVAKRMGYRPDPMLSALMAYRTQQQHRTFQGVLGWINGWPEKDYFLREEGCYSEYFIGARQRAETLGYKVESFWLQEEGLSTSRVQGILSARNVHGILIPPFPEDFEMPEFDWNLFQGVCFGYSVHDMRLHRVTANQFHNTLLMYEELLKKGYERIGFALPQFIDDRVDGQFSAAFLHMNSGRKKRSCLPPFLDLQDDGSRAAFLEYVTRYKPEVLMLHDPVYLDILKDAGYHVPEDIGVGLLSIMPNHHGVAGIYEYGLQTGSAAVDLLVAMLHRGEKGLPEVSSAMLINGQWNDGPSLRKCV